MSILPHTEGIKRAVAEAKRLDSDLTLNNFLRLSSLNTPLRLEQTS